MAQFPCCVETTKPNLLQKETAIALGEMEKGKMEKKRGEKKEEEEELEGRAGWAGVRQGSITCV